MIKVLITAKHVLCDLQGNNEYGHIDMKYNVKGNKN